MPLDEGAPAPEIAAENQHGDHCEPTFADPTVVYFYPRDDTPGCTAEAKQFEGTRDTLEMDGVAVYGVSTDGVESHRQFAEKHGIGFDLLADTDGELADAFGVERGFGDAVARTTFILDGGEVRRVFEDVDPDGHAEEIKAELRGMGVLTDG